MSTENRIAAVVGDIIFLDEFTAGRPLEENTVVKEHPSGAIRVIAHIDTGYVFTDHEGFPDAEFFEVVYVPDQEIDPADLPVWILDAAGDTWHLNNGAEDYTLQFSDGVWAESPTNQAMPYTEIRDEYGIDVEVFGP